MALIPPLFINCVVAIGTSVNEQKQWIGTGFLFGNLFERTDDGQNTYKVYLVTNKHVLGNLDLIFIRLNKQNNISATDYPIPLKNETGSLLWTGHPDPEIDVAVLLLNINVAREQGMICSFFQCDKHAKKVSDLMNDETSEGDSIYVMGFPMGMIAEDRQHVFVRSGIISRIKDLFEGRSKDFVVDAFTFPGNSGGPVISRPEIHSIVGTRAPEQSNLIGIVKSYLTYQDVAISRQTNLPRVIFEENSGLSMVEPVDHILETIEESERIITDST